MLRAFWISSVVIVGLAIALTGIAAGAEPLASWNETPRKQAIVDFVHKVTRAGSPTYVAPADRIATFDNDGTLWPEQPMYTQLAFVIDRVKALAPQHPEWRSTQPFQAVLEGDLKTLGATGEKGLLQLLMATHAGVTTAEFEEIVRNWVATARHPRFGKPYDELAYQPMVELLDYLRSHGFRTYIVSGGGVEFMRPMTQKLYGIPPEQVIGSTIRTQFELRNGEPVLTRLPEIDFIDDKAGKPVGIHKFIGRRPIAAFGNSQGDREMLQWVTAGEGPRLGMLLLHDDADREFAYGPAAGLPGTHFGAFPESLLVEAETSRWEVIRMRSDWARIFPEPAR